MGRETDTMRPFVASLPWHDVFSSVHIVCGMEQEFIPAIPFHG